MRRLAGPLRAGDAVALVCPSGPPSAERLDDAVRRVEGLGLAVRQGRHCRERLGYLAGPDGGRAEDLAWALTDPNIRAVICVTGGYGASRLLDLLPWADIARARPRPLLGFSDITALHLALATIDWPSLHGAMPGGGTWDGYNADGVAAALMRDDAPWRLDPPREMPPPVSLVPGVAEGVLVGGNLSLIIAAFGTRWALEAAGKILLLEDVGEEVYRLDRYLTQLHHAAGFRGVAGVVIGEWVGIERREGSLSLDEVLADRLGGLGVPVLAGLPLGHGRFRATVPLGCRVRISAAPQPEASFLTILESPYG